MRHYSISSDSRSSTSFRVFCSQSRNASCSLAPRVIGNALLIRPQRCLWASRIPRSWWRHFRRSSGISEYLAASSSANSFVDFDGFSEAAFANRTAVTTMRLRWTSVLGSVGGGERASRIARTLRTLGNFGRTGFRPSVGRRTGGVSDGGSVASSVTCRGDRCGRQSSSLTTTK